MEKDRHIDAFFEDLNGKLSDEAKELVVKQLDSRVDEEGNFFLRFSKEKSMHDEFWITDQGKCFRIKVYIFAV